MVDKLDDQPSVAKRWIPWLRNNDDVSAKNVDFSFKELESDIKGLSPAQLKLIIDLIDQMKIRNEEGKNSVDQNSKY